MAEKEYIERGALLENLKKQYGEELGWQYTVNMSDVGMMIEDAEAADVVEVVRCEDCLHCDYIYPEKRIGEEARLAYCCRLIKCTTKPNGFCYCGKRKEQA